MKDLIGFAVGFVSFGITYLVAMLIKKAVLSVKKHMARKKEQKRLVDKLTENKISRLENDILGLSKKVKNLTEGKKIISVNEAMGISPLTEKEVLEIYESSEPMEVLGKKYGVAAATIHKIKRGYSWKRVTRQNREKREKGCKKLRSINLQNKEITVKRVITDQLFRLYDRGSAAKLSKKYNIQSAIIYKWRVYSPKTALLRYKDVYDLKELRSIYEKHKKTKTLDEINDMFVELYYKENGDTQKLRAITTAFFRLEYWED